MKKIFISHSENDSAFVKELVDLLFFIGISKSRESIFCSSYKWYGVPLDEDIFSHIKEELNQDVHVIFILSDNFYKSSPSLNEMGAAWALTKDHSMIIIPPFSYGDIKGVVNPRQNSIYINDSERLDVFREKMLHICGLTSGDYGEWNSYKNEFLGKINALINEKYQQQTNDTSLYRVNIFKIRPSETGKIEIDARLINDSIVPVRYDRMSLKLLGNDGKAFIDENVDPSIFSDITIYPNESKRIVFELNQEFTIYPKRWNVNIRWREYY